MTKDIGGVWRTVGGRRIFIKDGEDLTTAMKKSGKFKKEEIKEKTQNNNEQYKNVVYHGTKHDFEEFDENKIGSNKRIGNAGLNVGKGFYFTEEKNVAEAYGKEGYVKKVELTIDKPLDFENYKGVSSKQIDDYIKKYEKDNIKAYKELFGYSEKEAHDELKNYMKKEFEKPSGIINYADSRSNGDFKEYVKIMEYMGYDGIVNRKNHEIVALKKNQIKILK